MKREAAHVYAQALFRLAAEKGLSDAIEQDLRLVRQVLGSDDRLLPFFESPRIPTARKKEIIRRVFAGINPYVVNTLLVLLDRRRLGEAIAMIDEYIRISNEKKGIGVAIVETVRPLTEEEKAGFSSVFAKKVGKRSLEIENVINSDLLGGVKVRIENRIYDGSLRGKLDRLERKLVRNEM
jgi:ATP synthase, F1 delta subunit